MIFTYFKKTGEARDRLGEWDGDIGYEFDYEVDDVDVLFAVSDLVNETYFEGKLNTKNFRKFVRDFDLLECLIEGFEDELQDFFEEDAMASQGDL